jgi:hypothetical protein
VAGDPSDVDGPWFSFPTLETQVDARSADKSDIVFFLLS